MNRVIYYYQTFCGLEQILKLETIPVTHIHVSSIHFGINQGKEYIHLNDNPPDSPIFDTLWKETKELHDRGVEIRLMVGGAGCAFIELFNNFEQCYNLLKQTIISRPWINGIDLDVEESIDIYDLVMLINRIKADFGIDFKISLAPIQGALESDICGFGGFKYKHLMELVGDKIEYLNGQFYGNFTLDSYSTAINNGYEPSKIIIGMMSEQFEPGNFNKCLDTIIKIKKKYINFGGVFVWEYLNAPPGKNPVDWALLINAVINKY